MAVFNPDVQVAQIPGPGNYRPISEPKADTTAGQALKDIGQVFDLGVKAADTGVKDYIQDTLQNEASAVRDQYTDALSKTRDELQQYGSKGLDILQGSGGLGPNGDKLPDSLAGLSDTITVLQNAKGAGKISSTYYWGRLNDITKDLRSEFPGYRDYIDQTVSQITGHNPANQLISTMTQDINRLASQGQSPAATKMLSEIYSHLDQRGMPDVLKNFLQTGDIMQAATGYNEITRFKSDFDRVKADAETNKLTREQAKAEAQDSMTLNAGRYINFKLESMTLNIPGMERSTALDLVRRGVNGEFNDQTNRAIGQAIMAQRGQVYRDVWSNWTESGILKQYGSPEEAKKQLDAYFAATYDSVANDIYKGDWASVGLSKKALEDFVGDSTRDFVKNNPIPSAQVGVARAIGGDQATQAVLKNMFGTDVPNAMKSYWNANTLKLYTQQVGSVTQGEPKVPFTFSDAIDDARGHKIISPTNNDVQKKNADKLVDGYIQQIDYLAKPLSPDRVPFAKNIAAAAFDARDNKLLRQFNGDPVAQMNVFKRMTSDAVAFNISNLAKSDPSIMEKYKGWVSSSYGILFENSILQLNTLKAHELPEPKWNTDTHQWIPYTMRDINRNPAQNMGLFNNEAAVYKANASIKQMNDGLQRVVSMAKVANMSGDQIDNYLYGLFRNVGVEEGSLPASMLRSVLHGQAQQNAPQKATNGRTEGNSALPYGDDGRPSSVADWVNNLEQLARKQDQKSVAPKVVHNPMSEGDIISVGVQDIPKGMTSEEFRAQQAAEQRAKDNKRKRK